MMAMHSTESRLARLLLFAATCWATGFSNDDACYLDSMDTRKGLVQRHLAFCCFELVHRARNPGQSPSP